MPQLAEQTDAQKQECINSLKSVKHEIKRAYDQAGTDIDDDLSTTF